MLQRLDSSLVKHKGKKLSSILDKEDTVRSDEFSSLQEWASSPHKVKVFKGGDYILSETLNVQCDELYTDGTVNVTMTETVPFIVLGSSSMEELGSLSSPIPKGTSYINVNTSKIKVGDILFLFDPTDFSFSNHRYYYRKGEAVTVSAILDGRILLAGGTFDSYTVGTKILKPTMSKKRVSGDFVVTFPKTTGQHTYSPNSAGLLAIQLRDSDFSGLSIKTTQASQAFIIRRCVNCYGYGIHNTQSIEGKSSLGLDSSLAIQNCQSIHFEGLFSGERHGSSVSGTGEQGGIVTRFITVGGEVLSTGRDSKLAADWHGNVEYSTYYGRLQGITAGGNHNTVLAGSIIESLGDAGIGGVNYNSPTIGFREINGTDFKFSGVNVVSKGKPSESYKGIVDLGSTASVLNAQTKNGGVIDFSNSVIVCEDTEHAIKIRSEDFPLTWGINLSNLVIESAGKRPIWIQAKTGKNCTFVNINGLKLNNNATECLISTEEPSLNYTYTGKVNVTVKQDTNSSQQTIKLPMPLPPNYIVTCVQLNITGTNFVVINDTRRAGEFRLTVRTSDLSNVVGKDEIIEIGYTVSL